MIRLIGFVSWGFSVSLLMLIVLGVDLSAPDVIMVFGGCLVGFPLGTFAARRLFRALNYRRMRREWIEVEREMHKARLVVKGREPHERHAR